MSILLAIGLAGAALLVALKVDSGETVWGLWLRGADAITFGWFARPEPATLAEATEREAVLRWGAAAMVALGGGVLAQWIVRPRR